MTRKTWGVLLDSGVVVLHSSTRAEAKAKKARWNAASRADRARGAIVFGRLAVGICGWVPAPPKPLALPRRRKRKAAGDV